MKNKVYIFGAGENGKELAAQLNVNGKVEIVAYIDNDKNKWGEKWGG